MRISTWSVPFSPTVLSRRCFKLSQPRACPGLQRDGEFVSCFSPWLVITLPTEEGWQGKYNSGLWNIITRYEYWPCLWSWGSEREANLVGCMISRDQYYNSIEKDKQVTQPIVKYFFSLRRVTWGAEPAILVGHLFLVVPIGILYTYVIQTYREYKRCMALVTAPLSCPLNEVIMSIENKKDVHSHRYMTTLLVFGFIVLGWGLVCCGVSASSTTSYWSVERNIRASLHECMPNRALSG